MNWKKKNNVKSALSDDDEQQIQTIITQDPSQYNSSSIRLVENRIYFYDDVTNDSILELNKTLVELDIKLQNTKNVLGDDFSPTIHLHIKTDGGDLYSAFANIDTIERLKSKVYTYVEGCVASAGTIMSVVGVKRFMGRRSFLLIHQLSADIYGKYSELQDEMYNSDKLMKFIKVHYKEYTKIPMKKLDDLLKCDIILDAEECLAYGIVDEIY